ncbi:hypothetical protein P3L10_008993 [Capsicum annuum]
MENSQQSGGNETEANAAAGGWEGQLTMWFIPHHTSSLIQGKLHHRRCRIRHHHCRRGGGLFGGLLRTITMLMEETTDRVPLMTKGNFVVFRELG